MPFGESPQSKFFVPTPGTYYVRLLSIHDADKAQTYADGKSSIPAVWSLAIYTLDGQPVRDPTNPLQIPAIAEGMSGQSTGFGKDGRPAKGRVWLTSFTKGLGLAFPDDAPLELVQQLVAQCTGAWARWTWGPNPDKTSKTLIIVREVEPMQQPAAMPMPVIVPRPTATVEVAAAPVQFAPAASTLAPAAPVFAPAATEAPPAPVFAAAPAAPLFPAQAAADAGGIPAMVFPT